MKPGKRFLWVLWSAWQSLGCIDSSIPLDATSLQGDCQRIQRLNSSSTLLFIKSNILGDGWLWTRLFMSSTKLPDASKGLLFVFMRLEGLSWIIISFMSWAPSFIESSKVNGSKSAQQKILTFNCWLLTLSPFFLLIIMAELGLGS